MTTRLFWCLQWVAEAHLAFNEDVATGYGWDAGIRPEEALVELLTYNDRDCQFTHFHKR